METFTNKVEFLRSVFGDVDIARDGINVAVRCPACGEKGSKKKLSINLNNWSCHCWVCDLKGKNLSLILTKYLSPSVSDRYRVKFLTDDYEPAICNEEIKVELPDDFRLLCNNFKCKDPDVKACVRYLLSRGLTRDDFWYFKIGTSGSGRHRRRVIIPSFDADGEINFFVSRSIDKNTKPKYLNSKANKSDIIFNEVNLNWSKEITIVEGPFDLFSCNKNSTCLLGSSLGESSYLFKRIVSNKTPVLLALDSDMKVKSNRIADSLVSYCCDVRILDLKHFHDVGDMTRDEFLSLRKGSQLWNIEQSIKEKIKSIKTGSMI